MQFSGEELTFKRIFNYILGLYLITLGVAFSIKSGLGSAPVSTIPYAMNLIWYIEIGLATFIFHAFAVIFELILLRGDFNKKHFLQVFVGVIFGLFTSFSVGLMNFIPPAYDILIALVMTLLSVFFIALGLFFYVPTNIIPLAIDGLTQAIAIVSNRPFSSVKICVDITIVFTALLLSYGFLGQWGSVGIGTILSALLIGVTVRYIHKFHGRLSGGTVDLKKM